MIIVFFAGLFLIRNLLLPLVSDDYSYAFIWNGEGGGNIAYGITGDFQRVTSFYDIAVSQWSHYFTWGGRTVAHCLIQFFVWIGKPFFDIANTLIFVLLILLIHWLAKSPISKISVIWILLMIWICVPEWVSTMLWLTGACNYLWMAVLQLLFLLPHVKSFFGEEIKFNCSLLILYIALSFLAGWSNEAGGFAVLFFVSAIIILQKRQKNLQSWQIAGLAAFLIGYAFLMLAPGNFARAATGIYNSNVHWSFDLLIVHLTGSFAEILINESILFIPIIYCLFKFNISSVNSKLILLFTLSGLIVPLIMLFSPEFPLRSCFMSPIFLLIASTISLRFIKLPPINKILVYSFVGVWLISIAAALYVDFSIYRQTQQRLKLIADQSNETLIKVPPLHPSYRIEKFLGLKVFGSTAINLGGDLNRDSKMGQNVLFAKYYGLKQIAVSDEVSR